MKRFLLLFALLMFSISIVLAQKDNSYKWSFTAKCGLNSLDGDGDSSIQRAIGASIEYDFLPFAGVSVDYYHFPERGTTFTTQIN